MATIQVKESTRRLKSGQTVKVKSYSRTIGFEHFAGSKHYQGIMGAKGWQTSRVKRKKKVLNYLKSHDFGKATNGLAHPRTAKIRTAIVRTTPYSYSRKARGYTNKWSKTHTAGGTHLKRIKRRHLRNVKRSIWG
jgi:hypothetical protein